MSLKSKLLFILVIKSVLVNAQDTDNNKLRYSLGVKIGLQHSTFRFSNDTSINYAQASSMPIGIEYQRILGPSWAFVAEFNYILVDMVKPDNPSKTLYTFTQFDLPLSLRFRSKGELKIIGDVGLGLSLLDRSIVQSKFKFDDQFSKFLITYHIGCGIEASLTRSAAISILGRYQGLGSDVQIRNFGAIMGLKIYMHN